MRFTANQFQAGVVRRADATVTGRNERCPCGSGRKYKRCCGRQQTSADDFSVDLQRASELSLEHDGDSVARAFDILRDLNRRTNLDDDQRDSIRLCSAHVYQRQGRHQEALQEIAALRSSERNFTARARVLRANSLYALGELSAACDLFDEAISNSQKDAHPRLHAMILIDAGRAHLEAGNDRKARVCWEEARSLLQDSPQDSENLGRVEANLASLLLDDDDDSAQLRGVQAMEASSRRKYSIGDWQGLANNYNRLAHYYRRKRRYGAALACMRLDLFFCRDLGDERAVASTLLSRAALYFELRQLSPARRNNKEAQQIATKLNDTNLMAKLNLQYKHISETRMKHEDIGRSAACGCGSGNNYESCCGRADFEPSGTWMSIGVAPWVDAIAQSETGAPRGASRLDAVLWQGDEVRKRQSWAQMVPHDGWAEIREMLDATNLHLDVAERFAEGAHLQPDEVAAPLAALVFSVCALEAFTNQVGFFVYETAQDPESLRYWRGAAMPASLEEFHFCALKDKWNMLGKCLCRNSWPPPNPLWQDVQLVIEVRNELVHFAVVEYEQVQPAPRNHPILGRIPKHVEIRKIPRAWQARLLTPSFGSWCVENAKALIDHFREGYRLQRDSG